MKIIALLFAYIIRNKKDCLLLQFKQLKHTYGIVYVNFKTLESKYLYFQTSLKDPWLIPHYDPSYKFPIAGWLFWFAGCTTDGIICPISEYVIPFFSNQQVIKDKHGNMYVIATHDKDIIRKHKAYLRQVCQVKAHFNRFANTITFSD